MVVVAGSAARATIRPGPSYRRGVMLARIAVVVTGLSAVLCDAAVLLAVFRSRSPAAMLIVVTAMASALLASVLIAAWALAGRRRVVGVALLALIVPLVLLALAVLFRLGIAQRTGQVVEIACLIYWTNLALYIVGKYGRRLRLAERVASDGSAALE